MIIYEISRQITISTNHKSNLSANFCAQRFDSTAEQNEKKLNVLRGDVTKERTEHVSTCLKAFCIFGILLTESKEKTQ